MKRPTAEQRMLALLEKQRHLWVQAKTLGTEGDCATSEVPDRIDTIRATIPATDEIRHHTRGGVDYYKLATKEAV